MISNTPLVSVVIPCYNQAHFLPKAIESVKRQTYPAIEIVVVDDGSADNTKEVACSYPGVKYVYQANGGLSAARNKGIEHSTGEYLVFLDSDDWLYPCGIEQNVSYILQHPEVAFVSGAYDQVFVDENVIRSVVKGKISNHYYLLLQRNYIGMIATVLFKRTVFHEFQYDPSLKNCEDYDLYLKVASKYPIAYHTHKIAAYRLYGNNMSANIPAMLEGVLLMLERHKKGLVTWREHLACFRGCSFYKNYFCKKLYTKLRHKKTPVTNQALLFLLRYQPRLYFKFLLTQLLFR